MEEKYTYKDSDAILIWELNRLQEHFSPEKMAEIILRDYPEEISRIKKLPTGNMGDSVLIAVSLL